MNRRQPCEHFAHGLSFDRDNPYVDVFALKIDQAAHL